ncbi:hypothetical protein OAL43_00500 [bacterium]|nr:hypothetical protein [bacterium]
MRVVIQTGTKRTLLDEVLSSRGEGVLRMSDDDSRLKQEFEKLLKQPDAPQQIDQWMWSELSSGSHSRKHPWNLAVYCSLAEDALHGLVPRSRTVVIRDVDVTQRSIDFYTDIRSEKVVSLRDRAASQRICWTFYRHETRLQLRLDARAELLPLDSVNEQWHRTPQHSRGAYASVDPPGTTLTQSSTHQHKASVSIDPLSVSSASLGDVAIGRAVLQIEKAKDNFCVIRTIVDSVEMVHLAPDGNRRVHFVYDAEGRCDEVSWLVP